MDYKYLGSLDQNEFEKLDDKAKDELLFNLGLLVRTYGITIPGQTLYDGSFEEIIPLSQQNSEYIFNSDLTEEFYEFIVDHYHHRIGNDLAIFNINFDDETFGLSEKKKRKKGLLYFDIFFKLTIRDRPIGARYDSEQEIRAEKRFKTLFDAKNDLVYQLKESKNILIHYLLGKQEKFDKKLFNSNTLIQSIIKFENNLSILKSLNKRFDIEKEDFFTPISKAKTIYKKYSNDFDSLKQLEFLEQELNDKSNLNHSYVVSLFFFFKEGLIKIPRENKFRSIINEFFNIDLSRLKVSDSSNEMHQKRLDLIKSKWSKF